MVCIAGAVAVRRQRGAHFTSSFEAEVGALVLAFEWLQQCCESVLYLICSDSRSALVTIESGSLHRHHFLGDLEQALRRVRGAVVFQWIPGHSGSLGNERADQEAGRQAPPAAETSEALTRLPMSYRTAWSGIREALETPIVHERTRLVFAQPRSRSS